jgi:hypothetical protein
VKTIEEIKKIRQVLVEQRLNLVDQLMADLDNRLANLKHIEKAIKNIDTMIAKDDLPWGNVHIFKIPPHPG